MRFFLCMQSYAKIPNRQPPPRNRIAGRRLSGVWKRAISVRSRGRGCISLLFLYLCKDEVTKRVYFIGNERMLIAMIVIGYDLVSYLLHYSSARCVTFKELFVCKSNNKTGDFDMNLPDFFSISYKFFRKSGFIRRYTIAQKDFERTCADYCISGEKGFASRLSNSLD